MNVMTCLTLLFFVFAVFKVSLDAAPPNILFIVADDLGTRIAPAGYPGIKTPNLDALAKGGMTFNRAYCQYPVCGPSRASFLSGMYPESTKVLDNVSQIDNTRPGTPSLPSHFQKAGYWTAATGKVFHKSGENPQGAWNQVTSFQNDEMAMEKEARLAFEKKHGSIEGKNAKLWREEKLRIAPQTRDQGLKGVGPGFGPTGLPDEGHSDGKNARQVAFWITNKAHGDRPFFIACGFQKPHIPFLAPDSYYSLYPAESLQFDLDPFDDWKNRPLIAQTKQFAEYGFPEIGKEDLDRRRGYVQAYHACVSFVDTQLGLVLQALKECGQWENTIIVFVGDNGYHLGEHFMWGKVMLFEESAKIPMIIRVPGVTKGSKNDGLAEMVDLFPTLTELSSVPTPSALQGCSMAPMLRDPSAPGKDSAYTVVLRGKSPQDLGRAIRFEKWRYTEWVDKKDRELYDLVADPRERNNLAEAAEYAGTVKELSARLAERTRVASGLP